MHNNRPSTCENSFHLTTSHQHQSSHGNRRRFSTPLHPRPAPRRGHDYQRRAIQHPQLRLLDPQSPKHPRRLQHRQENNRKPTPHTPHTTTSNTFPSLQPAQKNDIFPIPVNTTYRNGYIGLAHLSSTSHRDSGLGPEIYIEFNLTGTATLSGQPPLRVKGREAFITVSTDDWGSWARPDFAIVSYYLPGVPAKTLLNKVPAWQTPKDVSFVVAVNPKKRVVGMNASVEPNVVKDLVGWALKGVFFAHEKAVGWVVGKPI